MKFYYKRGKIDWRIVTLVLFLCSVNILTIKTIYIASFIAFIEAIVLLLSICKQRTDLFLFSFLIILSTTFEFAMFVDSSLKSVPSIVMLPSLKGYFFLLISLCPIYSILKNYHVWKKLKKGSGLYQFTYFAFITFIIGVIIGVISILIENLPIPFRITFFFRDIINIGMFSLYTLYFIFSILYYKHFAKQLEIILFSTLIGLIFTAFIFTYLGFRGDYELQEIILMPLSFFFSIFIIYFLCFKEYYKKHIIILLLLSGIVIILQFHYSNALSGKSWLAVLYLCITLSYISYKKIKIFFYIGMILLLFASSFIYNAMDKHKYESDSLSSSKLSQALFLISIANIDWYEKLPLSPKIRIEEFLNTSTEYINNPYYTITGKGFGSGHKDHRYSYGTFNSSAFSIEEYNNNYFISMHETINTIFLKFGLLGILLFIVLLFYSYKNINITPWLGIGSIWLLFFWGYSFSLMAIGLPSLILGLYKTSNK